MDMLAIGVAWALTSLCVWGASIVYRRLRRRRAVALLFLVYVEVERRLCQHDGCELHEICPVCGRRNERKD